MIYLYLFGTCFHFIYVFMIIGNKMIGLPWWTQVFCVVPILKGMLPVWLYNRFHQNVRKG